MAFRELQISNFLGGACPRTPLAGVGPRVETTHSKSWIHPCSFKLLPTLHDYLLAICIVNPVLALLVLAILGNNLVLVVIPKFSALRIVFNIFIFPLALIDILVGLVVQLVFVVYIAGNNQPGLLLQFSRYLYTQII